MCSEFLKKSQFRENILIIAPFNKIPCRNQTLESDAFQLSLGYEFGTIRISLNKMQSRMKTFSLSLFSIVTSRAFPIDGKHVCRDWPSNCDWTISSLSFHLLAKKNLMNLNEWFSNMKAILMCQNVSDDK